MLAENHICESIEDENHQRLFKNLSEAKDYVVQQLETDSFRRFQVKVHGAHPIHLAIKANNKEELVELIKQKNQLDAITQEGFLFHFISFYFILFYFIC